MENRQEEFDKWMKILGIAPRFYQNDFKMHPATEGRWAEIKEFSCNYFPVENIFMSGPCGTGKTMNSIAIIIEHLKYYIETEKNFHTSIRYYNSEKLYNDWLKHAKEGSGQYFIENLKEPSLLVLDDLGQGEISDSFKRWLYNLVNIRWEWGKSIVSSTNLSSTEFRVLFGDALLSRLCSGKIWKFSGADHRLEKHKNDIADKPENG